MTIRWDEPTVRDAMEMGPGAFVEPAPVEGDSDTGFWERGLINLRLENSAASAAHKYFYYGSDEEDQQDFNPFDNLEDRYWNFTDEIMNARSPDQLSQTKQFIDRNIQDREIQMEDGLSAFGWSMGAGLLDPISWPFMAFAVAKVGGGAIKTGLRTAGIGVVEAGIQESALHATQPSRTWEETLMAMGATGVLGFSIGGVVGKSAKTKADAVATLKQIEDDLVDTLENGGLRDVPDTDVNNGDLSAAKFDDPDAPTLEGEGVTGWMGKLGKWVAPWSPGIRLLNSKVTEGRLFANLTWNHGFRLNKNQKGIRSTRSVDARIVNMQKRLTFKAVSRGQELYAEMSGAGFTSARLTAKYRAGMTLPQFMEETGKAMTRGDIHEIAEVQKYAQHLRKEVFNPIAKAYQELGDLPSYLKTDYAASYLPRVYNKVFIRQNRAEWESMLDEHFTSKGMGINERTEAIRQVTDSILNTPSGRLYGDIASTNTSRLKDRTLDIEDSILQQGGFLETNVQNVLHHYIRSTIPELILKQNTDYRGVRGLIADVKVKARAEAKAKGKSVRDTLKEKRQADIDNLEHTKPSVLKKFVADRINRRFDKLVDDFKAAEGAELLKKSEGKSQKMQQHLQRLSEERVQKFANKVNKDRNVKLGEVDGKKVSELIDIERAGIAVRYKTKIPADVKVAKEAVFNNMKEEVELLESIAPEKIIMKTEIDAIRDAHLERQRLATTSKEKAKIQKEMDGDIRDAEGMRDQMLGLNTPLGQETKAVTNASRNLRGIMFLVHLGGMTISAIADVARPMIQNGFKSYMRHLPAAFYTFSKGLKKHKRALQELGYGTDGMTNSRIYAMSDITDVTEGKVGRMSANFATYTFMNQWNSFWKQTSAFIAQDTFIRSARKFEKLSKNKKEDFLRAGVDASVAKRIVAESDNFEQLPGGGWVANTQQWQDRQVADLFDMIVDSDVERTINTPTIGDRPLLMRYETGKIIMQFKSFFLAAHNQTFLPALQKISMGDLTPVMGLAATMPLSAMTYIIKMHLSGRSDELENASANDWIFQSADRSGLFPIIMEGFNIANKFSNGRIGQTIGITQSSRYYNRNKFGSLLGPGLGFMNDAFDVLGSAVDEKDFTASDLHKARRLVPYQNLFYARWIFDTIEDASVEAANLPDRRGN